MIRDSQRILIEAQDLDELKKNLSGWESHERKYGLTQEGKEIVKLIKQRINEKT